MSLDSLFSLMAERKASDIYISADAPINIKIDGVTAALNAERMRPNQVISLLGERINHVQFRTLEAEQELNIALPVPGVGRFRISLFKQRGTVAAVIRFIPPDVPNFNDLGLPPVLKDMVLQQRGLILVVGAAGSGKSTTIASMLDYRNETCTGHMLTFEDPIEFLFRNKKSVINQREIGTDATSMQIALKNAMRQAPDVMFIGEIRDRETMAAALGYAMSGHLLVATLHATNSAHALNRVISFYQSDARQALYQDLASTLKAIVSQRLVRSSRGGRMAAVELLLNTGHATELIERGDVMALKAAMERSLATGSMTFEQSLFQLLQDDLISHDEALAASDSRTNLLWMINNAGKAVEPGITPEPKHASFSEITLNI
jgi:twitching motility protein PilU